MDDKLNKSTAEARALTDEELDHASGGRYCVIHGTGAYACDTCMVWLVTRPGVVLVHKKCGKEMRFLTAEQRKNLEENPQYQKVASSEAANG